jgi:hypothetical protein
MPHGQEMSFGYRTTLVVASVVLLGVGCGWAQENERRGGAGTESSEVASGLYNTKLEAGLLSSKLGETTGHGGAGATGEAGAGGGEKGFSIARTATGLGIGSAYATYSAGAISRPTVMAGAAGQSGLTNASVSALGGTNQTLLRGQTNNLPLTRPGAATALDPGRASGTATERSATPQPAPR